MRYMGHLLTPKVYDGIFDFVSIFFDHVLFRVITLLKQYCKKTALETLIELPRHEFREF